MSWRDYKICSKCEKSLHKSEYSKGKGYKDGLRSSCKQCNLNYVKDNRAIYNANYAKRRSSKRSATPEWSDLEKIKILYEKAKWLESLTGLQYDVDHIIPLQNSNVCGLHVWHNLQILEKSLNRKKNNKFTL